MDTIVKENKTKLTIRFALFYIISVLIILFLYSVIFPATEDAGSTTAAHPLDESSVPATGLVSRLEFLNNSYRNLKALDLQFARINADSIGAEAFYSFDSTSVQAEMRLSKSLDSMSKIAHVLPDRQESLRLQTFIESYKMALEDRAAMQNFYKNAPAPEEHDNSPQMIQQLQYEIKARNKHIAELENELYNLKKSTGH